MLEVKGSLRTIINMDDYIFGYEYCSKCVLFCGDIDCEECIKEHIKFIIEEENK